jgi:exonuclease III
LDICSTGINLDKAKGKSNQSEERENNISKDKRILEAGYSEDSIQIIIYLISLYCLSGIDKKEYYNFKRKVL